MNKKRINWWIVVAVVVIGIPVGFVLTGVLSKTMSTDKDSAQTVAPENMEATTDTVSEQAYASVTEIVEQPVDSPAVVEAPAVAPEPVAAKPEPVAVKPAPVKKELTPEQIAERERREELKRQKAEEQRLLAEQREQERQRKLEEAREAERQKAEAALKAEEERKAEQARLQKLAKDQFVAEVKNMVASGKSSSKVPEDCIVVVNNKQTTNYQNFRNGVKLGSYSRINVTKVEGDGFATRVYVNAAVNTADD